MPSQQAAGPWGGLAAAQVCGLPMLSGWFALAVATASFSALFFAFADCFAPEIFGAEPFESPCAIFARACDPLRDDLEKLLGKKMPALGRANGRRQ